jgi:hypothetical protein
MQKERKFKIICVGEGKGSGIAVPKQFDSIVSYSGEEVKIKL